MSFQIIKEQDQAYIMHTYNRVDVALVRGKNATVWDESGKKYIDFTSGIGVNALGCADDAWVRAVSEQAGQIQHLSNYYYSPKAAELAKRLTNAAGLSKVFFGNSGAEANECAIKVARKYGESRGADQIITLENSFHGRTLATLAATGQDAFHKDFLPLTPGFRYARANDISSVEALIDDKVCAVMVEFVQGEGGVMPLEQAFVQKLRDLCTDKRILFIADEVQTGVGRTGACFAYQNYQVSPDIATCAKGLAGGLPIGACMVSEPLSDTLKPGMHGSTFGGNPVSCAAAIEVLSRVNDPLFLKEVARKGDKIRQAVEKMPNIEFVRGQGLMLGIKLREREAANALTECAAQGLLVLTAKALIRFLPPLSITDEELDEGLTIFARVMAKI